MIHKNQTFERKNLQLRKRTVAKLSPKEMMRIKGGDSNIGNVLQTTIKPALIAGSSGVCIGTVGIYVTTHIALIIAYTVLPIGEGEEFQ